VSDIVLIEEKSNPLLNRIEVKCIIKGVNGMLKRADAVKMVAERLNYGNKFVIPISLKGESGKRDIKGVFYIYDDESTARAQLPRYVIARLTGEKVEKKGKVKKEEEGKAGKKQ